MKPNKEQSRAKNHLKTKEEQLKDLTGTRWYHNSAALLGERQHQHLHSVQSKKKKISSHHPTVREMTPREAGSPSAQEAGLQ